MHIVANITLDITNPHLFDDSFSLQITCGGSSIQNGQIYAEGGQCISIQARSSGFKSAEQTSNSKNCGRYFDDYC